MARVERDHGVVLVPEVRVVGEGRMSAAAHDMTASARWRCSTVATPPSARCRWRAARACSRRCCNAGVDAHGVDKGARRARAPAYAAVSTGCSSRCTAAAARTARCRARWSAIGMPYTGSGVLGSALAMDKRRTKLVWRALGIPTPGLPWWSATKPISSARCRRSASLHSSSRYTKARASAWRRCATRRACIARGSRRPVIDREVLVERLIEGPEYTAAILDERGAAADPLAAGAHASTTTRPSTPTVRYRISLPLRTGHGERGDAQAAQPRRLRGGGRRAAGAVWTCSATATGDPWFIDVNTAPGMTTHSLVPMAAAAAGMSFETLVVRILEASE